MRTADPNHSAYRHFNCVPEITPLKAPFVPEWLIDSEEAAAMLGVHPKTLQRMARAGTIKAMRVGKLWRFRPSWIDEWINRTAATR